MKMQAFCSYHGWIKERSVATATAEAFLHQMVCGGLVTVYELPEHAGRIPTMAAFAHGEVIEGGLRPRS